MTQITSCNSPNSDAAPMSIQQGSDDAKSVANSTLLSNPLPILGDQRQMQIKELTESAFGKYILEGTLSHDMTIESILRVNGEPLEIDRDSLIDLLTFYFTHKLKPLIMNELPEECESNVEDDSMANYQKAIEMVLYTFEIAESIEQRIQKAAGDLWNSVSSSSAAEISFVKAVFAEVIYGQQLQMIVDKYIVRISKKNNGILIDFVVKILKVLHALKRKNGSSEFVELTEDFFENWQAQQDVLRQLKDGFISARDLLQLRDNSNKSPIWGSLKIKTRTVLDVENRTDIANLGFYTGEAVNPEYNMNFDNFIKKVRGNYNFLENAHNYIQFLFPLREKGLYRAQPLTKYESEQFRINPTIQKNILISYEMLLDFYGVVLSCKESGKVKRSSNYLERYDNFNTYLHNNLRMTRILKFLGTVGFEHFKLPLILHWIDEIFKHHHLLDCSTACIEYWIPTLCREEDLIVAEKRVMTLTNSFLERKLYKVEEESWAYQPIPIDTSSGTSFLNVQPEYPEVEHPLDIIKWKQHAKALKRKRKDNQKNETPKKRAKI